MGWLYAIFAAIGRFFSGLWRMLAGDPEAFEVSELVGEDE
jgi:hypothetical protein